MQKNQLFNILCYYLKEAGITFNKRKLKQLLFTHPEQNSLYSMVDALDELNIENIALRLNMDNLIANNFPAIVHTGINRGKFVVVENICEDKVFYYSVEAGHAVESLEEFSDKWSGIAFYAVQDEIQAELERKKSFKMGHLLHWRAAIAVVAGLACVISWSIAVPWSLNVLLFLSLSILGLVVSILLAMHEFGESNRLLHKVCHLNRLTNCNAVLKSPASKLFGWLSMSDIGLCYFVGGLFTLILSGITQNPGDTVFEAYTRSNALHACKITCH